MSRPTRIIAIIMWTAMGAGWAWLFWWCCRHQYEFRGIPVVYP